MNFNEYQEGTSKTNIYSSAISDLLFPIWFALSASSPEYESDMKAALERLNEVEELLNLCYVVLGYTGEVAELANKTKKILRLDKTIEQFKVEAAGEIGDGYWYGIGQLPTLLGLNAAEIAQNNLEKLQSRQERNVLRGDGDER